MIHFTIPSLMQDTSTNSSEASSCPVNHSAWTSFIPPNTEKRPASQHDTNLQCPASTTITQPPDQKNLQATTKTMGQRIPLGTTRELSSIPRVIKNKNNNESDNNEEKLWIYPSEQMFFNAMKRKNWNPREEDMRVVIPMHNAVNEKAWKEILKWEKLHENKCGGPKLAKFQGKANDITPKARLLNLLGYKLPFDRHDWVVDRCGKQVTYIIDFYSGQPDPKFPQAVSFYLDVRPALTFDGALHRLRRWTNDLIMNWMN
ncbi:cytochrome c and c1 heme-lyase [Rhizophagus clarus]|uniref:Holocytochrome c-type synthase n=1 Tax=Rhizophagus clarus TaxID=94130 RepID=A0A8H3QC83_9GLOM|nr:cytochrome c and c1 heme-lyase [Rhizophagus clarus]